MKRCFPQWDGSSSIPLPAQSLTDMPTGKNDVGNFSLRFPFAVMIQGCIKLTGENEPAQASSIRVSPCHFLSTFIQLPSSWKLNESWPPVSFPNCIVSLGLQLCDKHCNWYIIEFIILAPEKVPWVHGFRVCSFCSILLPCASGDTEHHSRSLLHNRLLHFVTVKN